MLVKRGKHMDSPERLTQTDELRKPPSPEVADQSILQKTAENLSILGNGVLESVRNPSRRLAALGASTLALAGGVLLSTTTEKTSAGTFINKDFALNKGKPGHYPPTKFYNQQCAYNATNRPSSRNFIPTKTRYVNRNSNRWKIHFGEDSIQACSNMGTRKVSYFQQVQNPNTDEWRRFTNVRSIKSNKIFELYGSYKEPLSCHGAERKPRPNVRTVLRARWVPKKGNKKGYPLAKNWYQKTQKAHC
jgi:hypothetical protein